MEYGIRVTGNRKLPADPRELCPAGWLNILPEGPVRALYFGAEFCEERIPDRDTAGQVCSLARESGADAVLLTPLVTTRGLGRIARLLGQMVSSGWTPSVVFNDWGVLNLLRDSFPDLPKRAGRLINRGLRDPRVPESAASPDAGTGDRGRQVRSLLVRLGVEAVETDPDLEGGFLGGERAGLQRVLYLPYAFAASSRNCLVKADGVQPPGECFTKGLGAACPVVCEGHRHRVDRPDTAHPLWREGNTLFYEVPHCRAQAHLAQADRIVLFEGPTR